MRYAPYYDRFAAALLTNLAAPVVRGNLDSLVAWVGGEAGWSGTNVAVKGNNPLNIKSGTFRSYGISYDGVRKITNVDDGTQGYGTFTSLERGAAATAAYLKAAAHQHGYASAIEALRAAADPEVFLNAIAASDWAASHYGYPKTNHLIGNLRYVQGSPHSDPPKPKPENSVQFILAYDPPKSIAAPAGTVVRDFRGNTVLTQPTPTHYTTVGLVDGHSGHFAVKISTGKFAPDGKARYDYLEALIPDGQPEDL